MEIRALRKKKKKSISEAQLFQAIEKHIETSGFPKKSMMNEILLKIKVLEGKAEQAQKAILKADSLLEKTSEEVTRLRYKASKKLEELRSEFM